MTARTVVIAGGSRGIGGEVAMRRALAGDRVIVGCREKGARAHRLSEQVVAAGGRALDVRVGDLRSAAVRRELLRGVDRVDVLVLAASGGMEQGCGERDALALNRDALVALVEESLPRMAHGGVIVYLTSHQAHFSRDVAPEPEYALVAATKRAAEDALQALGGRIAAAGARVVTVSADVVVDSATTRLMERLRPGSTDARRAQVGTLPTTADVAGAVTDAIENPRPNAAIVYHGGARWFLEQRQASCPRIRRIAGEPICAVGLVRAVRDHLEGRGITASDRVLVCDASTPETALVLLAVIATGASVVVLDPGSPAVEVADIAERTRCSAAVSSLPLAAVPRLLDLGAAEALVTSADAPPDCACDGSAESILHPWADRVDGLLLWTSGSSGRPRGVVRSGMSVLENVRATVGAMRYRADDVLLPLLPISHQYGLSLVIAWWLSGCTLVLGNHRRPVQTLVSARALGVTVVDAAPPVIEDVLGAIEERGIDDVALRVRMWCVGGSPLRPSLARRFHQVTGHVLLDGYGSTELGNVALATLEHPEGLGLPLPGVDVVVRHADGSPASSGEIGELWVRSAYSFSATIGDDRPTEMSRGWFRTGDLGAIDDRGVLRVIGRAGAVHRGGFTVYVSGIESRADEAGVPATVIALPDERRGAHLTAFIEDDGSTRSRWSDRLRSALPPQEWPNRVVVLPRLPRLGNGKVDRARLTREAEDGRKLARKGAARAGS